MDLALVDDSFEFVRDHMVQNLGKVRQTKSLVIGVLGDTDAELVALPGVHNAFHVVEPGVDFTLDDRLKVGLHLLACDVDAGCQRVLELARVDIRTVDDNLVVLDLIHRLGQNELAGGVLCGPELDLHVGLADNFAFKCGSKRDRNRELLGLDLDSAQLERLLDGLVVIQTAFQRARNLIFAEVNVDHDREAQRNGACARGDDDIVDRAEGVDEGGNTLFGVGKQPCKIARLHVAEDQRRTDGNGDDVDDCRNVMTQRDDAQLQTHLDACVGALLDHIADQEGHDALGLVVLDDLCCVFAVFRLAEHDGNAGNIARDQRHAERTDDGIGHKADAGHSCSLIGVLRLDKLETFENFCADCGCKTGVQCLTEVLLVGNQALEDAHTCRKIAERFDLDAGCCINRGEVISSIGEREFLVCTVFGNCVVDRALGQTGDGIRAAINQIS